MEKKCVKKKTVKEHTLNAEALSWLQNIQWSSGHFFMLNSAVHELFSANKYENANNS